MLKKVIALIVSCALLISLSGCTKAGTLDTRSSVNNSMNDVDAPVSLSKENMYLAGTYTGQWDATEHYARTYYEMKADQKFVKPSSSFLIKVELQINKNGTYSIKTDDSQTPVIFDAFLNNTSVSELEAGALFEGDSKKHTSYYNERGISFSDLIDKMNRELPLDNLKIYETGNLSINDNTIKLMNGVATIEHQDNVVRLTLNDGNLYTGNKTQFIKRGE